MDVDIRNVNGHYEAFRNGKFLVSGDTYLEVVKELEGDDNVVEYTCLVCGAKSYSSCTEKTGSECIQKGCNGTIVLAENLKDAPKVGEQLCLFSQQ